MVTVTKFSTKDLESFDTVIYKFFTKRDNYKLETALVSGSNIPEYNEHTLFLIQKPNRGNIQNIIIGYDSTENIQAISNKDEPNYSRELGCDLVRHVLTSVSRIGLPPNQYKVVLDYDVNVGGTVVSVSFVRFDDELYLLQPSISSSRLTEIYLGKYSDFVPYIKVLDKAINFNIEKSINSVSESNEAEEVAEADRRLSWYRTTSNTSSYRISTL